MKEVKQLTITFNPDHEGVYVLVNIDGEYRKNI